MINTIVEHKGVRKLIKATNDASLLLIDISGLISSARDSEIKVVAGVSKEEFNKWLTDNYIFCSKSEGYFDKNKKWFTESYLQLKFYLDNNA